MKILFFIETLHSGGKERRLVELTKGLSKHSDIEMEIVLTQEGINYKDILNIDIKIHYLIRKTPKDPRVFYQFFKIAKKFKPDIIHVWGRMVAIYAIPTKKLLKIPMINNEITDALTNVLPPELSLRISFKYSDKIISNSKAGIVAYDAPLNKSTVIYNGFDFERIVDLEGEQSIRQKFNIQTKYVVAMVASFSDYKDYHTYIKASMKVLDQRKDITLLCIGSGESTYYQNMVASEKYNNIRFLGRQKSVENIMNICNIGVLATFTEGISNSILEFMAMGKPVIVTGEGGSSELISHNKNGFLLESGNFEGLAKMMIFLIENKALRDDYGKYSKKIVLEKFDINTMIDKFKKEYNKFI